RGRLNLAGTGLEAGRVIYRQEPAFASRLHFGSRLVFDRSGALFVTAGERFQLPNESQNPANTIGKIVRITTDGAPAAGN
ncbi:PQQ-dependent sugar dehydrogenase, partial [Acinetobacter baumannii]